MSHTVLFDGPLWCMLTTDYLDDCVMRNVRRNFYARLMGDKDRDLARQVQRIHGQVPPSDPDSVLYTRVMVIRVHGQVRTYTEHPIFETVDSLFPVPFSTFMKPYVDRMAELKQQIEDLTDYIEYIKPHMGPVLAAASYEQLLQDSE